MPVMMVVTMMRGVMARLIRETRAGEQKNDCRKCQ